MKPLKLHLGCGNKCIPGWYHIDVIPFPHVDLCHEIDNLPMIEDNSVEVIYCCHVLEHFLRRDVVRVLLEWHRILQPGGTLRISVPNFAVLSSIYQNTNNLDAVIGPLFGRQNYLYNFHYSAFDYNSLKGLLEGTGFKGIQLYDWRKTEHAAIDDYSQAYYPHMDKENGVLISLNMEAIKP